jgi:hypothetical protein
MRMRKSFKKKYTLTEQELRRLYGIINQQLDGVAKDSTYSFEITFKNGAQDTYQSIDEVISVENNDRWQIKDLSIQTRSQSTEYSINITFESDGLLGRSIDLIVEGPDRNWAYITSSLIEERIIKICRFSIRVIGFNLGSLLTLLGSILTIAIAATKLFPALPSTRDSIILPYSITIGVSLTILLIGLLMSDLYLIPSSIFYWGDRTKSIDRLYKTRNFIFSGIIIALLVGIAGSIIATYISSFFTKK